jgi:antitoxin component of RelBE/YafQ-DinJ toxin-antitoxin module
MNKPKFKKKQIITLALEKEIKDKLEKEADKLGLTTSAYIRMLILKNS